MKNLVILIGNLGSDPELRYTQAGTAVSTLSVATSRKWKDKQGQKQEETEWHRVQIWDHTAEFAGNYLKKGDKVYVEGRLKTNKWQDQSGNDRYTTEVVASGLHSLTPKSEGKSEPKQQKPDPQHPQDGGSLGTGEDVPF